MGKVIDRFANLNINNDYLKPKESSLGHNKTQFSDPQGSGCGSGRNIDRNTGTSRYRVWAHHTEDEAKKGAMAGRAQIVWREGVNSAIHGQSMLVDPKTYGDDVIILVCGQAARSRLYQ